MRNPRPSVLRRAAALFCCLLTACGPDESAPPRSAAPLPDVTRPLVAPTAEAATTAAPPDLHTPESAPATLAEAESRLQEVLDSIEARAVLYADTFPEDIKVDRRHRADRMTAQVLWRQSRQRDCLLYAMYQPDDVPQRNAVARCARVASIARIAWWREQPAPSPDGRPAEPSAPGCPNATSTWDMIYCGDTLYQDADRRLRRLSDSLRTVTPDTAAWDRAQQSWRRSMRRDCQVRENKFEGGSIVPIIRLACYEGHLNERAIWLRWLATPPPRAP
jgi:uncharacterized protein YecT (DUF1311 family)